MGQRCYESTNVRVSSSGTCVHVTMEDAESSTVLLLSATEIDSFVQELQEARSETFTEVQIAEATEKVLKMHPELFPEGTSDDEIREEAISYLRNGIQV